MPSVLLLFPPDASFEARRLAGVLAERVAGAEAREFRSHHGPRLFREWRRLATGERPILHVFGRAALAAAALATDATIVFTATRWPSPRDVAWLRAFSRYRPVRIVCDSDTERRVWVTGGLPADRCVLIRPGVSLVRMHDRVAARSRFGWGAGDRVIFTPLPPLGTGRAEALWAGSLMNVLDPSVKHLAWDPPPARGVDSLLRRLLDPSSAAAFADPTPQAGFAAADAIMLPPTETTPATLIAMAMASGKPVVAPTTPGVCELLEDRHTALLAREPTIQAMTMRMTDLFADDAMRAKITDRARAEVYDFFLLSRLAEDFRRFYATLAHGHATESTVVPSGNALAPSSVD